MLSVSGFYIIILFVGCITCLIHSRKVCVYTHNSVIVLLQVSTNIPIKQYDSYCIIGPQRFERDLLQYISQKATMMWLYWLGANVPSN